MQWKGKPSAVTVLILLKDTIGFDRTTTETDSWVTQRREHQGALSFVRSSKYV